MTGRFMVGNISVSCSIVAAVVRFSDTERYKSVYDSAQTMIDFIFFF